MERNRLLTRRSILTDLGGGALAVAILGPAVVACGSSADDSGSATSDERTTTSPSADSSTTTSAAPTTQAAAAESDTGDDGAADASPATTGLAWHQVNFGFVSAYLLVRGDKVALVDTGTRGSVGQIEKSLVAIDRGWADLDHVILTHLHGDHVGALPAVLERASSATAYAGAADVDGISSPRALTPVSDGDEVFGMEIVGTPGHTAGHISVLDPEGSVLVAGDALTAAGGEIAGALPQYTDDMGAAAESIKKMGQRRFDTVLVGHGGPISGSADALVADLGETL